MDPIVKVIFPKDSSHGYVEMVIRFMVANTCDVQFEWEGNTHSFLLIRWIIENETYQTTVKSVTREGSIEEALKEFLWSS